MASSPAILEIAYFLPFKVETVEEICEDKQDWDPERLFAKLGIRSRHISAPEETATDLAYHAACRLFEQSRVLRDEVDYVILCTQSPDHFLPSGACVLQSRLGLRKTIGAFDFNLGCSGFVYGLQLASALISSGNASNVLLLTSDTYSKHTNSKDRTTRPLFGDGAAATLIGLSDGERKIGNFDVGTDGRGSANLVVPAGGFRKPRSALTSIEETDEHGCTRSAEDLYMDGSAVFAFAITTVPRLVRKALNAASLTIDDIDHFVFHQANRYMLEELGKRLRIPTEKMVIDVETVGNTVSATIPIAIKRGLESGLIRDGQRLMLVGFGVGLSWAACDIVL